ncbi:MAG: hypothetical protein HQ469_12075 [Cyanobacteria bacterium]|nr:hypothetical protein [Cyanobacteria bacterium bin.275]
MAALYPAQGVVISVKPYCQLRKVLIIWQAVELDLKWILWQASGRLQIKLSANRPSIHS